jgi:hypothetical protein
MSKPIYILKKREILEAVKRLKAWYKFELDEMVSCPLCKLRSRSALSQCSTCPWAWLEGMESLRHEVNPCVKYGREKFGEDIYDLRIKRPKEWVEHRLKMLADWEKKIKED